MNRWKKKKTNEHVNKLSTSKPQNTTEQQKGVTTNTQKNQDESPEN